MCIRDSIYVDDENDDYNLMTMGMTMAKVRMMTMVKISPRPGNKPEVEVVAEVAVYCNHSEAGS